MENELDALKKDYNAFLTRFYKASAFMDNSEMPAQEKERTLPGFMAIIKGLNDILDKMKSMGFSPLNDEVLGGFNL